MSRRYRSLSRARRRGQALLLAVLIMIFAALLSASFILVVSVNLNQTARQTDKNRAVASATAGLDYINERLTYSDEGERWRPQIPASSEMGYSTYYTALDRAQGWADDFAKFPDPRNLSFSDDSPLFLAKVEPASRAGVLKITVIGLSPTDPTAFHTEIRYKGGYERNPIAQVMRVVGNYDFKNNVVPVAQVKNGFTYDTATKEVPLENVSGEFPSGAFAVTLGGPNTPTRTTRGFAVASYDKSDPNNPKLILASSPTAPADVPTAGERVELAANLGAPLGIDDDNNPATPNTPFAPDILPQVSDGNVTGGVKVNGGLWWTGNIIADQLRSINQASSTNSPAGSLQASGVVAKDAGASVTLSSAEVSTSVDMLNSSQATFPVNNSAWAGTNTTKYDLVNDGWDRLRGVPTASTRNVSSFRPPALDSPENLERYRNLTRFSKPANPSDAATVSLYGGGGQGIYIDNGQDKEKVGGGTQEMSQSQLVTMWLSPQGTTTNFTRTGTPDADLASTTTSLEEKHLRGWVGPDEFRARGVLIELNNTTSPPTLLITRDARDDNTTTDTGRALGPVAEKAWKNPTTGTPQTGVYTKELPWPINGVIFAEGNVRIRGVVTAAPRSLTVVSMGNIYIEDSLDAAPRKILLLAKKNVVMNPTRVLGRPDAQTTATAEQTVAAGPNATLTVADGLSFKKGDFIQASTVQGYITSDPTIDQITFTATSGGTVPDRTLVRTPLVATQVTSGVPFSVIASPNDVIQRRFTLPNPLPAALRLALIHQVDRKTGLSVATKLPPPAADGTPYIKPVPPDYIYLSNKRVLDTTVTTSPQPFQPQATTVADLNKMLRADYSKPAPAGTDKFPDPAPTTEDDAKAKTLTVISTEMNNKQAHLEPTMGGIGWQYDVTAASGYGSLPFLYLAGVGNRYDYGVKPTLPRPADPVGWATNIAKSNVATDTYEVPLATSIALWLNGAATTVSDDLSVTPKANQFGFSPFFQQNASVAPPILEEDILTADQGFHQTDVRNSTLDSRILAGWNSDSNSLVLRQSDGLMGITDTTPLPDYRLMGIKLEDADLTGTASVNPAHTFNVNAFVYAQTGSWFVIPGAAFDNRLRGDETKAYFDLNNNNTADDGEYLDEDGNGYDDGDFPDLNRNGISEPGEKRAMARYFLYNYQINFTGAIAENQTPLVNNAGSAVGAVADWMNKWATTTVAGRTVTRDRMKYTFDPAVALGQLQNDTGFRLPHTLDLTSQG